MVANYRVKLKTIRWKDVTYKQDALYLMEVVLVASNMFIMIITFPSELEHMT